MIKTEYVSPFHATVLMCGLWRLMMGCLMLCIYRQFAQQMCDNWETVKQLCGSPYLLSASRYAFGVSPVLLRKNFPK